MGRLIFNLAVFLIFGVIVAAPFVESETTLVDVIHSAENQLRRERESSALQRFWDLVADMERLRRFSRDLAEATKQKMKENREKARDAREAAKRLKRETQEGVRNTRARQKEQLRMYKESIRR